MLARAAEVESQALVTHIAAKKPHGAWDAEVHYPATSVVVSRRDGKAYVISDGKLEAAYPVTFKGPLRRVGTHAYTLVGPTADGRSIAWLAFGLGKTSRDAHIVTRQSDAALQRVTFRDEQRAMAIARTFHPGTTLLVTDASAPAPTRNSPEDFAVITSEPGR